MLGFSQKGAGFSRRRAANSIIIGAKIYEEGKRGEGRKGGNTSEEREEVEGGGRRRAGSNFVVLFTSSVVGSRGHRRFIPDQRTHGRVYRHLYTCIHFTFS